MAEFIITEGFGGAGEAGEQVVSESVKAAYAGTDPLGYWRYPLVTQEAVREPELDLGAIEVIRSNRRPPAT